MILETDIVSNGGGVEECWVSEDQAGTTSFNPDYMCSVFRSATMSYNATRKSAIVLFSKMT